MILRRGDSSVPGLVVVLESLGDSLFHAEQKSLAVQAVAAKRGCFLGIGG